MPLDQTRRLLATTSLVCLLHTVSTSWAAAPADYPGRYAVGSLVGQFSVEQGAAVYAVPIAVPPGIAGVEPELSVSYNSRAGNGLLGVGFSLDGLSRITRCAATPAQDGMHAGGRVHYDARDRFCLDGQRLVAVHGDYGAHGTRYRTEIDGFSRITSIGTQGSGPKKFRVETKAGQTLEFGFTADARVENAGTLVVARDTVQTWSLNAVIDAVGNRIDFAYDKDRARGTHRIRVIRYGPVRVRFRYESRPDVRSSFYRGARTLIDRRLAAIETAHVDSGIVAVYEFSYEQSAVGGASRLVAVTQRDRAGNRLPPTRFEWGDERTGFGPLQTWLDRKYPNGAHALLAWSSGSRRTVYGTFQDVNGDGLLDRVDDGVRAAVTVQGPKGMTRTTVHQTVAAMRVALNTGNGFTPPREWSDQPGPASAKTYGVVQPTLGSDNDELCVFLDIDRDGLVDRVQHGYRGQMGIWVARNDGQGFQPMARWDYQAFIDKQYRPSWNDGAASAFFDINGDGLPDKLNHRRRDNEPGLWVSLNRGGDAKAFSAPQDWRVPGAAARQNVPFWRDDAGNTLSGFVDINADGLPDRVNHRNDATGQPGLWVALNDGRGFRALVDRWSFATPRAEQYRPVWASGNHAEFVDVNGDGLPDRVHYRDYASQRDGIFVALNTGDGFAGFTEWRIPGAVAAQYRTARTQGGNTWGAFVDVNGDGLPDRVYNRNHATGVHGIWVAINRGDRFGPLVRWQHDAPRNEYYLPSWRSGELAAFQDMNGDGLPDRVISVAGPSESRMIRVALNRYHNAIVAIQDGLGQRIELDYGDLTDRALYTPSDTDNATTVSVRSALKVVASVWRDDGLKGLRATHYRYGGAKLDRRGRGFLGFAWETVTDAETGTTTRTDYRQDFPHVGQVRATTTTTADGTVLSSSRVSYGSQSRTHRGTRPDGAARDYRVVFPHVASRVDTEFELDGRQVSRTTTRYRDHDAYGNVGTVEVVSEAGGETLTRTTVSSYTNVIDQGRWHLGRLKRSRVTHRTGNGQAQTRTSAFTYYPDTGLLRDEIIEPDRPRFRQVTRYHYDAHGNRTRVTVSGQGVSPRVTTTAFANRYHGRFATSVINSLGHGETREYDPGTGKPTRLTGPNDLATRWDYDGWGRQVRERRADGTVTSTYRRWVRAGDDAHAPANALYRVQVDSSGAAPTTTYYDRLGRVVRKLSVGFDGRRVYQDTEYDARGREARASLPYFRGDPVYWVDTRYDILDRVIEKRFDTGKGVLVTRFDYDGLTTTETRFRDNNAVHGFHQFTRTTKNVHGKVASVEQPHGARIEHRYDPVGNLVRTVQHDDNTGRQVVTTLRYDVRGRKVTMDDPGMGTWHYLHDVFGNLVRQTDAKGQVTRMVYDALGRMLERHDADGKHTTWHYDTAANGIGKLHRVILHGRDGRPLHTTVHRYDDKGREIGADRVFEGQAFTTRVDYDEASRISATTGPNGFVVRNLYNRHGYLEARVSPKGTNRDYDRAALLELYDERRRSFRAATDAASELLSLYRAIEDRAEGYATLARQQPLMAKLPPAIRADVIAALERAAEDSYHAMQLLQAQIVLTLDMAEELLVVMGSLADRIAQAELWRKASLQRQLDDFLRDPNVTVWWRATSRDAAGRLTGQRAGNGLVTVQDFDRATGQMNSTTTGFEYGDLLRSVDYVYDLRDNVRERHDQVQNVHEYFDYDGLERLTRAEMRGPIAALNGVTDYRYDALGNLTFKTGVGHYRYGTPDRDRRNAGPHAVLVAANDAYGYDANGNVVSGDGRRIAWSTYNKPTRLERNGTVIDFRYGPDRKRYKKTVGTAQGVDETTLYVGKRYERIEKGTGEVLHKHFIYADGQLAAIHVDTAVNGVMQPNDDTRYLHRDALGSIDTITDARGEVVDRMAYTPFGEARPVMPRFIDRPTLATFNNRGFTGHEQLDAIGLVHMNGRVYDPKLGRFLSADPHVQAPHNSQSYNRYAYVVNNPLKYADPSGYFFKKLFKSVKKLIKFAVVAALAYVTFAAASTWAAFAAAEATSSAFLMANWATVANVVGAAAAGFTVGATTTLLSGGSLGSAIQNGFKVGLVAGVSAGIAGFIGGLETVGAVGKDILHGVAQGAISEVSGGDFRSGFMGGFVGHAGGSLVKQSPRLMDTLGRDVWTRTATAAVLGGTAAAAGGGKFANGAISAAFAHLFNSEGTRTRSFTVQKTDENLVWKDGKPYTVERKAYGDWTDTLIDDAANSVVSLSGGPPKSMNGVVGMGVPNVPNGFQYRRVTVWDVPVVDRVPMGYVYEYSEGGSVFDTQFIGKYPTGLSVRGLDFTSAIPARSWTEVRNCGVGGCSAATTFP